MSFINQNYKDKPSLIKPIGIIVAILLVIGAATFISKSSNDLEELTIDVKPSGLDPDKNVSEVGDVEEVIARWVEANPRAIIQAVENMQKKEIAQRNQKAQENVSTKKDELFNDNSPSYTPKGYDVTIVEFFDYSCGYCKRGNKTINQLIKSDKKVRVIYKEYPILGQKSYELAQVALAVQKVKPTAYHKVHNAFMTGKATNTQSAIKLATKYGVSSAKIRKVLKNNLDEINEIIAKNHNLGKSIGINGTPGYVVGDQLVPGAVSLAEFQRRIKEVRSK